MKKGRKWDDKVVRVRPKCLEAAREVALKINARLVAEGILKPTEESSVKLIDKLNDVSQDQQMTVEIDINEIPLACRNLLTRSVTQEDISKMSGAKVSTKGRFMTQAEKIMAKLTGEKALYLCVQGTVQANIDLAVQRITSIISSTCNIPPTSLSITSQNMPTSSYKPFLLSGMTPSLNFTSQTLAFVQDKLFIGLEHAPPSFDIKSKLLGPSGTYLHHIQSETGAKVLLRGRGSGFNEPTSGREAFEPMHIYIQHSNQVGLNQARVLAQSLLQTVQHEYATFQQQLAFMPPTVSPGTASMLAGLQQQQQSYTNSVNTVWPNNVSNSTLPNNNSNVMYPQQSTMLPTVYPTPPLSTPSMNHSSLKSGLPPIPYTFPIDNFIPKPLVPAKRPPLLQSSPLMPLYGNMQQQQISSFSAVQNYYKHYIQTSSDISAGDTSTTMIKIETSNSGNIVASNANNKMVDSCGQDDDDDFSHPTPSVPRRRFQEKIEDVAENKNNVHDNHEEIKADDKSIMPPPPLPTSLPAIKSKAKSRKSKLSESKSEKDKDIMPPPSIITNKHKQNPDEKTKDGKDTKYNRESKKVSNSRSSESPSRPKKLKGALKSVVAYGSDSDDSDT